MESNYRDCFSGLSNLASQTKRTGLLWINWESAEVCDPSLALRPGAETDWTPELEICDWQ